MSDGFAYICNFLENRCEHDTFTIEDLRNEITASGYAAYSSKHLKFKLKDKYGDHIYFAGINGRPDVICFKDFCSHLISEHWCAARKRRKVSVLSA